MAKVSVLAVFFLLAAFVVFESGVALAGHVDCGDVLTSNTKLDGDLNCASSGETALTIGADKVKLDLNGFKITADSCGGCYGVHIVGRKSVTIKNDTVVGGEQGVRGEDVAKLKIKEVEFIGQSSSHSLCILGGDNVKVTRSSFSIGSASLGLEAIRLECVKRVVVDDVQIDGGFIGINFACGLCDGSEAPSTGVVKNSTIENTVIGVLVANSTDAKIQNNEIKDSFSGIENGFAAAVPVTPIQVKKNHIHHLTFGVFADSATDLDIKDNYIHDNDSVGVLLLDVDSSKIKKNTVEDNGVHGILLDTDSTGNDIKENESNTNAEFGIVDLSTGNKTAGTANTYKKNDCSGNTSGPSSPSGLCGDQDGDSEDGDSED